MSGTKIKDQILAENGCACVLSDVWLFETPMDYSPPGSSVNGILQARILKWFAIF